MSIPEHKPGGMREMLAIALPMVVSNACDTIMTVTDRYFLSQLGPEQMSAAMGGGLYCFTMMSFFIGLTGYSTAMVAQNFGADRKGRCFTVTVQALLIGVLAYPVLVALIPVGHWIFDVSGISETQLHYQTQYFDILMYGCFISLGRIILANFFSGIGKTRVVMVASLITMAVNIVANYILIFGKFGVPALGMKGAAYGTLFAGVCGVLTLVVLLIRSTHASEYPLVSSCRIDKEALFRLIRFGYPAGIEFALNILAFAFMVSLFHGHSLLTATASTVTFNWDMVAFVPLIGLEIATTSMVGRYCGAKDHDTAHKSVISALKLGFMYSGVIFIFFAFFPAQLIAVFRPDTATEVFDQATPMAVTMLRIASIYVGIEAVFIVFSGALRGAGDTTWAMIISCSVHWFLVGVLYACLKVLNTTPETGWLAITLVFSVCSVFFYLRFRTGKWRGIEVLN